MYKSGNFGLRADILGLERVMIGLGLDEAK